jgi:hypothetical protein
MSGSEKKAFTIPEFCESHGISRTTFLKLGREGRGPALMHVGGATRISVEAAARWRRAMERSPATHQRGKAAAAARARKAEVATAAAE